MSSWHKGWVRVCFALPADTPGCLNPLGSVWAEGRGARPWEPFTFLCLYTSLLFLSLMHGPRKLLLQKQPPLLTLNFSPLPLRSS